jgi:hypothetical protein
MPRSLPPVFVFSNAFCIIPLDSSSLSTAVILFHLFFNHGQCIPILCIIKSNLRVSHYRLCTIWPILLLKTCHSLFTLHLKVIKRSPIPKDKQLEPAPGLTLCKKKTPQSGRSLPWSVTVEVLAAFIYSLLLHGALLKEALLSSLQLLLPVFVSILDFT